MSKPDIDTSIKVADLKTEKESEKRDGAKKGVVTLSTGVALKVKQVPSMTLLHVMNQFDAPKVPTVMSEQTGRPMENPDDPAYKDAVGRWQMQASDALMNVLILFGTELVSVPKDFPKPSDNGWVEKLRLVGGNVNPGDENWRYLVWVKSEAAPIDEDVDQLMSEVGRLSGVSEADVEKAVQTFPRDKR